jgi:hypothetical protein
MERFRRADDREQILPPAAVLDSRRGHGDAARWASIALKEIGFVRLADVD